MTSLAKLVFSQSKNTGIKGLVESGLIPIEEIDAMHKVIQRPGFGRLCTYLVAVNDRNPKRLEDGRDAYAKAAGDIPKTMAEMVNAVVELREEGALH